MLALGRFSPTKGRDVVLDACELAAARGLEGTLELRGAASTDAELAYRRRLEERVGGRVRLAEPVSRAEVPALRTPQQCAGSWPSSVTLGFPDGSSVVLPAPIACSPGFAGLLDELPLALRFRCGDAAELAERLLGFAASTAEARAQAVRELRRRVEAGHAAGHWAEGVLSRL